MLIVVAVEHEGQVRCGICDAIEEKLQSEGWKNGGIDYCTFRLRRNGTMALPKVAFAYDELLNIWAQAAMTDNDPTETPYVYDTKTRRLWRPYDDESKTQDFGPPPSRQAHR